MKGHSKELACYLLGIGELLNGLKQGNNIISYRNANPGTHSKWIIIASIRITWSTYKNKVSWGTWVAQSVE